MLRKPEKPKTETPAQPARKTGRFKFVKLEERIAPACRYNANAGKYVGCGGGGRGGGYK